jgi:hypothetical protein
MKESQSSEAEETVTKRNENSLEGGFYFKVGACSDGQ